MYSFNWNLTKWALCHNGHYIQMKITLSGLSFWSCFKKNMLFRDENGIKFEWNKLKVSSHPTLRLPFHFLSGVTANKPLFPVKPRLVRWRAHASARWHLKTPGSFDVMSLDTTLELSRHTANKDHALTTTTGKSQNSNKLQKRKTGKWRGNGVFLSVQWTFQRLNAPAELTVVTVEFSELQAHFREGWILHSDHDRPLPLSGEEGGGEACK